MRRALSRLKRLFAPEPPPPAPLFGMQTALEGLAARGFSPRIVFDIGASNGAWTELAAPLWPEAHFHCFEPLEQRRAAMEEMKQRYPGRITHHALGVGDADGELSLGVTEDLWASSFAYKGASAQTAPVRTLDSLLQEGAIAPPQLVKIDVQGFERRVIEGGRRTLEACDFVLMECAFYPFCADMQRLDQSIAFMAEAGFAPYEFVDFLRRPADGAMGQCDILFIRREHAWMKDTRWA